MVQVLCSLGPATHWFPDEKFCFQQRRAYGGNPFCHHLQDETKSGIRKLYLTHIGRPSQLTPKWAFCRHRWYRTTPHVSMQRFSTIKLKMRSAEGYTNNVFVRLCPFRNKLYFTRCQQQALDTNKEHAKPTKWPTGDCFGSADFHAGLSDGSIEGPCWWSGFVDASPAPI